MKRKNLKKGSLKGENKRKKWEGRVYVSREEQKRESNTKIFHKNIIG
jgi:hypothetical protein